MWKEPLKASLRVGWAWAAIETLSAIKPVRARQARDMSLGCDFMAGTFGFLSRLSWPHAVQRDRGRQAPVFIELGHTMKILIQAVSRLIQLKCICGTTILAMVLPGRRKRLSATASGSTPHRIFKGTIAEISEWVDGFRRHFPGVARASRRRAE